MSAPGGISSPSSDRLSPVADSTTAPAAGDSRVDELSGFLQEMGVTGRVYDELLARPDLIQDPSPVRAWWWYSLIQKGIRNPAAMAISYLRRGDPPWRGYLDLVRLWDKVESQERLDLEETLQRNWSAEELAHYWSKLNLEWTPSAFIALKELYLANPAIVGL